MELFAVFLAFLSFGVWFRGASVRLAVFVVILVTFVVWPQLVRAAEFEVMSILLLSLFARRCWELLSAVVLILPTLICAHLD